MLSVLYICLVPLNLVIISFNMVVSYMSYISTNPCISPKKLISFYEDRLWIYRDIPIYHLMMNLDRLEPRSMI